HYRLRPSQRPTRSGPSRLPWVCRLARGWGRFCSPPPCRLRRTTGTLSLRRRTPKIRRHGARHGTPWHAILAARASSGSTVPAPNVGRVGGGILSACLRGPGFFSAATRARQGTPSGRARLGLQVAPHPLSVLAGAHPV